MVWIYREPVAPTPCEGICEITPALVRSYPDGHCRIYMYICKYMSVHKDTFFTYVRV